MPGLHNTPTGLPSRPGGPLQAQKRQALRILSQISDNGHAPVPQSIPSVKRKHVSLFAYGSSDTEEEGLASDLGPTAYSGQELKRSRGTSDEIETSESSYTDDQDILGSNVWDDGDLDDSPSSGRINESFFDLNHNEELTVECTRSAEPLQEVDLSDIYGEQRRCVLAKRF